MNTLILVAALAALFGGLLMLMLAATGAVEGENRSNRISRRLRDVTTSAPVHREQVHSSSGSTIQRNAVDLAGRFTARSDIDLTLSTLLDAAGLKWTPAEWLLMHVGAALGGGLAMALLADFRIVPALLGVAAGVLIPFAYLTIKAKRRRKAFSAGLADMLQLMAGSLSAGYSVPQAMDTVARESAGPIAEELNRALVQARLGVPLEDALEEVAVRMRSVDFSWVVMAIRVQREIGGNLAEVLENVAETLRDRDRVRRQVDVLSAEGKLSAWVLGALPVVFSIYLILVRPDYISLLVTTGIGLALLVGALILFAIGVFWLTRIVKVEV